jgi:hypothetical protein
MNTKYLSANIDFALKWTQSICQQTLILHLSTKGDFGCKVKIVKLGQECKATELKGTDCGILFKGQQENSWSNS